MMKEQLVTLILLAMVGSAKAATFTCGATIFQSGAREGASWREVQDACGEPVIQSTRQWVYIKDDTRYVLSFSATGLLTGINSTPIVSRNYNSIK